MNIFKLLVLLSFLSYSFGSLWAYQEGDLVRIGTPPKEIELPFRDPENHKSMADRIGWAGDLGSGDIGNVYSQSGKAVKIIPLSGFTNVDEIAVTKIAGDLGIGPVFSDAWVTQKKGALYVAIEMELLPGDSLEKYIGRAIRNKDKRELQALQEQFRNRTDGKTYFFDRLFTILEKLAENKVSYDDVKYGNLMRPLNTSWQDMKIIDFDSAVIHSSEAKAAQATLNAPYVKIWIDMFEKTVPIEFQGQIAKQALEHLRTMALSSNQ